MDNKDTYNGSVGLVKGKQESISPLAKLKQAQLKATADIKKASMSGTQTFASIFDDSNATRVEPEGSVILDTVQDSAVALGQAGVNILSTGPTMLANADRPAQVILGGADTAVEGVAGLFGLDDEYRERRGDSVKNALDFLDSKGRGKPSTETGKGISKILDENEKGSFDLMALARKGIASAVSGTNKSLGEFNTQGHKDRAKTKQAENAQMESEIVAKYLRKTGAKSREDIGAIDSALMNAELAYEGMKNTDPRDIIPTTVGSIAYGVAASKGGAMKSLEAKNLVNVVEKEKVKGELKKKSAHLLEMKAVEAKEVARNKKADKKDPALDKHRTRLNDVVLDAKTLKANEARLNKFKVEKERNAIVSTNIAKMEAAGNANEVYSTVMGMDTDLLAEESTPYRELIAKGIEPEKAKQMLAERASSGTLGASALFAKASAKVTGTALEKGLAGKGAVSGAKDIVKASAGETIEESIQTGSGELSKAINLKNTVDDDKVVGEGVAMATGEAGVLGAFSAGGMTLAGQSVSAGKEASVGLSKIVADPIKDKVRKVSVAAVNRSATPEMKEAVKHVETTIQEIDTEFKAAIDNNDEDALYDVADKNRALQQETFTKLSQLAKRKLELSEQLKTANESEAVEIKKELRTATKEHDTYSLNVANLSTKAHAINKALDKALTDSARPVEDIVKDIAEAKDVSPQKAIRELEQIMQYNPDAISEEQANIVLNLGSEGYLKSNLIKVLKSDAELRATGKSDTTSGVARDKVEGSRTHTGLKEYRNGMYQALLGDDNSTPDTALALLDRLHSWAEGDNTRTALIEKGLQGDKTALGVLKNYYGIPRLNKKVAENIIAENKLLTDTYTSLAKLTGEIVPSLKSSIPALTPKAVTPTKTTTSTKPTSTGSKAKSKFQRGKVNTEAVKLKNTQLSALPDGYNKVEVRNSDRNTWFESTDDTGAVVDRVLPNSALPLLHLTQAGKFHEIKPEVIQKLWNEYTSDGLSESRKEEIQGKFLKTATYVNEQLKEQGITQSMQEYSKQFSPESSKTTTTEPEAVTEAPVKSESKVEPVTEKVTPKVSNVTDESLTDMQKKTDVELKAIIESDTATEESEISFEASEAYGVLSEPGITDLGDVYEEPVETGTLSEGLVEKSATETKTESDEDTLPVAKSEVRREEVSRRNSIKELFTFGKNNVINTTSNFLNTLDSISILKVLPKEFFVADTVDGTQPVAWENRHDTAMTAFTAFRTDAVKEIQFNSSRESIEADLTKVIKNNVGYNFYAADFINSEGKLPDNVWEAGILSSYQWLTTEGAGTLFKSDDDLRQILNLKKYEPIPSEAREVLTHGGTHPDTIEEALGRNFASILGLRVNNKADVDKSAQEKLNTSLGKLALRMAKESGILLNGANVSEKNIETWGGVEDSKAEGSTQYLIILHTYNKVGNRKEIQPIKVIEDLITSEKESGYLLGNVLAGDARRNLPQFSAALMPLTVPDTMKGTLQRVPKLVKAIIAKHASRPHQLKTGNYEEYAGFSQEKRLEMYGYTSEEVVETLPLHQREAAEARNKSIVLELNQIDDFVAQIDSRPHGRDTYFYLPHEVWRNMRMGMSSSTINTQRSKLHRHLVGLRDDKVKLNLRSTSRKDVRKNKDFLLAVALGFGISVDKKRENTALTNLDTLAQNNQSVHEGIVAMQSIQSGENTPENQVMVAKAVKTLGEKMHSFEAMSNYAKYLTALENNQGTVDVSLTAETDGMTNGPALALFLMGGLSTGIDELKELLNAAGFKFDNMPFSHGAWKEQEGTLDLYEQSSSKITAAFNDSPIPLANKQSLAYFMGTLGKDENDNFIFEDTPRDFPKETTVGSSYGQGDASVIRYAGSYGLTKVLDKLTSDESQFEVNKQHLIKALQAGTELSLVDLRNAFNASTSAEKKKAITQKIKVREGVLKAIVYNTNNLTFEGIYQKGLDKKTEGYIKSAYEDSYGVLLNEAISSNFAGLQLATKAIGVVSAVTHAKYEDALQKAIEAKKKALSDDPDVSFNALYDDLTPNQYSEVLAQVKSDMPAIKSQFSDNTAEEGIRVGKTRRQNTLDSSGNMSNAHLVGASGFGSTYIKERVNVNPGISGMAASIHSLDASIMYKTLAKFAVGNIFDAILSGVSNIHGASQELNRNTLEVLKAANPLEDFYGQFKRSGGFTENFTNMYTDAELSLFGSSLKELYLSAPANPNSTLTLGKIEKLVTGTKTEALVKGMLGKGLSKDMGFTDVMNILYGKEATPLLIRLIEVSPAEMTTEVDGVLSAMVEKNNAKKAQLLKDLKYVVQYNKEDAGVLNTPAGENDVLLDNGEGSMEDLTESFLESFKNPATWATEPEEVKETSSTAEEVDQSLISYSLIQVMGHVDPASNLGGVLKDMLTAHKDGASLENLQTIASRVTDPADRKILAWVHTYTPDGRTVSVYPRERTEEEKNFIKVMANYVQSGAISGKAKVTAFVKELGGKNDLLLKHILPLVPEGISIEVLSASRAKELRNKLGDKLFGELNSYYGMHSNGVIYLNANQVDYAGIRMETLAHELVHTALVGVDKVNSYKNLDTASKQRITLAKANLEKLRKDLLKDPTVNSQFGNALTNVDELIAWGLTNKDFQERLKKIKYTPKTSYWKEFKSILRKVFKVGNAKYSAFSQLLEGVDAYMATASTIQGGSTKPSAQASSKREERINSMNAEAIFDALKNTGDISYDNYLKELMGKVSGAIIAPINLVRQENNLGNLGASLKDKIILSTFNGQAPVPMQGLGSYGFTMSEQEVYLNQILNTALADTFTDSSRLGNRAQKLYKVAKRKVKPEDLRTSPSETTDQLQIKHDSIFGVSSNSEGAIHPVREFIALTQTNAKLREVLSNITVPKAFDVTEGSNLLDKIINLVNAAMVSFFGKWDSLPVGGTVTSQMDKISNQLLSIEVSHKSKLFNVPEQILSGSSKGLNTVAKTSYTLMTKMVKSDSLAGSTLNTLGDFFNTRGATLGHAAIKMNKLIMGKGRLNFAGMFVNQMMGEVDANADLQNDRFHRMLRHFKATIDTEGQERKGVVTNELKKALGKRLTPEQSKALTSTVIRSDLVSLLRDGIPPTDLVSLMQSDLLLKNKITQYETLLGAYVPKGSQTYNYYLNGAEAMGIEMITGEVTQPNTVSNAKRLMEMDGMPKGAKPVISERVEEILDVLGSLYALQTVPTNEKIVAADILVDHVNRPEESNGFTYMLTLHEAMQQDAKREQFKTNPKDFIKGYTPDTMNKGKDIKYARTSNNKELLKAGYTMVKQVATDKHDPNQASRFMYVHPDAGLNKYVQGIAYLHDNKAKGDSIFKYDIEHADQTTAIQIVESLNEVIDQKQKESLKMYYAPKANKGKRRTYMKATYDTQGNITDYRYTVSGDIKDQVLERDNSVFGVMGNMANINHVSPKTEEANKSLVDALGEQLKIDTAKGNLDGYVRLGNKSPDRKLRDAYRLLPEETRAYARSVLGSDEIPIRNDLYDIVVGSRRWSIRDVWGEDAQTKRSVAYVVSKILDGVTFGHGQRLVPVAEKGLMEAVSKAKDIIVNLSVSVLTDNVTSNTNYLVSRGLTMAEAVNWQTEGINEAKAYLKLKHEKIALELRITGEYAPKLHREYAKRIQEIDVLMAHNKARPLIEEGLLSTIAEELENTVDNSNSYATKLSKLVDRKVGANSKTRDALHGVALSQETEIYKVLSGLTQFSDFGSRYALMKKTTSRKENTLTFKQASSDAMRAFVNYDLPMHPGMQYASDIGVLWFPRWMISMQRTITHGFAEDPGRVIILAVIHLITGGMLTNVYSSIWGLKNPLDSVGFIERLLSGYGLHPSLRVI